MMSEDQTDLPPECCSECDSPSLQRLTDGRCWCHKCGKYVAVRQEAPESDTAVSDLDYTRREPRGGWF